MFRPRVLLKYHDRLVSQETRLPSSTQEFQLVGVSIGWIGKKKILGALPPLRPLKKRVCGNHPHICLV